MQRAALTRALTWLLGTVLVMVVAAGAIRVWGVSWGPRHSIRAPAAVLGPELMQGVADRAPEVRTAADAREVALDLTSSTLHFGLGHRSSLYFERSRAGHCVEYAELFARLFNELAARAQLAARACARVRRTEELSAPRPDHVGRPATRYRH